MRFSVEYLDAKTKTSDRTSVSLLNSFLNYHLIAEFHGWSYECLFIKLINNAPPKKKWKLKRTYDRCGDIELPVDFNETDPVDEFGKGLAQVRHAVDLVKTLEIKGVGDFKHQELISQLAKLEQIKPRSIEQYEALLGQKAAMDSQFQLRRVDGYINACKNYPQAHTKRLVGARIYEHFDGAELMPYSYMFTEIFSTLLRNAEISTPGYQEIYFCIDETLDKAKTDLAAEDWHKYTYCAMDIIEYRKASGPQKEQMLLDSLIGGLRLITAFDHLDPDKIENVIRLVSNGKTKTPLTYRVVENDLYNVQIHYEIGPDHTQKTPFYITITNKGTRAEVTQLIDHFDTWWAAYSLKKIRVGKAEVEIIGGGGLRGEVSRSADHLPDSYRFKLP